MTMLEMRHSLEDHLISLGFNWHGGGTDLTTGEMDVTFDHEGQTFLLRLKKLSVK